MEDSHKSKAQLIAEIEQLRDQVAALESKDNERTDDVLLKSKEGSIRILQRILS